MIFRVAGTSHLPRVTVSKVTVRQILKRFSSKSGGGIGKRVQGHVDAWARPWVDWWDVCEVVEYAVGELQ